ncbi:MAG TPA: Ada metal-binding domain-containing protein [Steroidobacteraceae bacterium]
MTKIWKLIGPDGRQYASHVPGALRGHSGTGIYGRLDCRAALRAIARGGYVAQRVFFLNAAHAQAAGYRPCGACMPESYLRWKPRKKPASVVDAGGRHP